jgi:hypothetical protein
MSRRGSVKLRLLLAAALVVGLGLLPVSSRGDHEVPEALKEIEQSIRATFDAFNREDIPAFVDGWTDRAFFGKNLFRLMVDQPFAKDETAMFREALWGEGTGGPITLRKLSNVKILDFMVIHGSADVELVQGHVLETYRLSMAKRKVVDRGWKIAGDEPLRVVPEGFPVVEVTLKEYAIDLDKSRLARNMVLALANSGKTPHEFVLFKLNPTGGTPEASIARGAWSLKPRETNQLVLTGLPAGRYLMTCCSVDPDHKPHCDKGMRVEVTIP